jgi:hypothetical protein
MLRSLDGTLEGSGIKLNERFSQCVNRRLDGFGWLHSSVAAHHLAAIQPTSWTSFIGATICIGWACGCPAARIIASTVGSAIPYASNSQLASNSLRAIRFAAIALFPIPRVRFSHPTIPASDAHQFSG